MNTRSILITGIAVILSFIAGFIVANSVNRKEIDDLKAELNRSMADKSSDANNNAELILSDDEVKKAIAQADNSAENIDLQKNVGIKLYQYAMTQDIAPAWLPEILPLLARVNEKEPKDMEVLVAMASINLYLGQSNKEQKNLEKAREYYKKALEIKPDNADVAADIGLTYLLADPPKPENAVSELQKALKINPKHEKSLISMVRAMILSKKQQEANEWLAKLKETNPANEFIPGLSAEIAKAETSTQK